MAVCRERNDKVRVEVRIRGEVFHNSRNHIRPRIADFLANPGDIDSILADMQEQAQVILGG